MPFNGSTINILFGLNDDDSKEFKALYREPNYENILEDLVGGSVAWTRNANQEVMSFLRTGLMEIAKTWFYFVSYKLVPSKHLSIVRRDKALLTYAIVTCYKFNVGKVIENSILMSEYHKAITHPSLITKLCEIVGVQIGENEEKCPPMQALHFP